MLVCQEIVNIRKHRITRSKLNELHGTENIFLKINDTKPVIMLSENLLL